jgi:hypothetical protein
MPGSGPRTVIRPAWTLIEDDMGLVAQVQHAPDVSTLHPGMGQLCVSTAWRTRTVVAAASPMASP